MLILVLLGMYFDAEVVFVTSQNLLFRLALAILWQRDYNGKGTFFSMTTLLTHTVAHSTKPSFRPKTNNQPLKKFLSLALS